ncbi:DUF4350 domain-containing protein [Mobilicoccus pelagius]|uniref:DUF4350 domain-containing protein n=1 Tax=Mobilicoccus pelagius TaxID=746032 RepID=UPI0002DED9A5|nr:DUF4350 domain-containing protein [Mobilicoccus pelagius]
MLVTLLAIAAVAAASLLLASRSTVRLPLDPETTGPRGTRAVTEVLTDRGVSTHVARSAEDLASARIGAGTTVVVPQPQLLSSTELDRVARLRPGRLVLVAPGAEALDALGIPAHPVGRAGRGPLISECATDLAATTDTLGGGGLTYRATSPGIATCFPDHTDEDDDPSHPPAGLLDVPARGDRPRTIIVGLPQAMTNVGITEASHAALALRTLGGTGDVLWYLPEPDPDDPRAGSTSAPPAPEWVDPVLLLVATAVVLFCLVRGRRLGRLTTEPLPVVVPAEETTLARSRLYRRTGDVRGVGDSLRDAARADLRHTLRLPADADDGRIVEAAAARLGDDDARTLLDLLTRPLAAGDLPEATRALHRLRRKVRRA